MLSRLSNRPDNCVSHTARDVQTTADCRPARRPDSVRRARRGHARHACRPAAAAAAAAAQCSLDAAAAPASPPPSERTVLQRTSNVHTAAATPAHRHDGQTDGQSLLLYLTDLITSTLSDNSASIGPPSQSVFTARCYASAVLAMGLCPCLCPSVTSRNSTKTAKFRITQTTPHDSPVTLVF